MKSSFFDTFKALSHYVEDFDDCWIYTIRAKRGTANTSKPGALAMEQVYLDGAMRILEKRDKINFHALFGGKFSLETYFAAESLIKDTIHLPHYTCPPLMRGEKEAIFHQRLNEIYESNTSLVDSNEDQEPELIIAFGLNSEEQTQNLKMCKNQIFINCYQQKDNKFAQISSNDINEIEKFI